MDFLVNITTGVIIAGVVILLRQKKGQSKEHVKITNKNVWRQIWITSLVVAGALFLLFLLGKLYFIYFGN